MSVTTPHAPPTATRLTALGLALVALSTLMYEILLTRIFSVTMWYHFAFVAISVAMFGMTVGALIVFLQPAWFPIAHAKRQLAIGSRVCSRSSSLLSFLTQLSIPFRVHPSVVAIYAIVFTYAVIAVPFVLERRARVARADAVPARCRPALCRGPDRRGARLRAARLGARDHRWPDRGARRSARWRRSAAVAFALRRRLAAPRAHERTHVAALLLVSAAGHTALVWRGFPVLRILYVKAGFEARPLYERWNSYSRIRVEGNPERLEKPYAWGLSRVYPEDRRVQQLHLDIDVAAGTVMTKAAATPRRSSTSKYDVTNIGYYVRPRRPRPGHRRRRRARHPVGAAFRRRVGRRRRDQPQHYRNGERALRRLHRTSRSRIRGCASSTTRRAATSRAARRRFDMIQISLIDTWAATAAGAFVLSENSLYTVEAWELFLKHLRPGRCAERVALVFPRSSRRGLSHDGARLGGARASRSRSIRRRTWRSSAARAAMAAQPVPTASAHCSSAPRRSRLRISRPCRTPRLGCASTSCSARRLPPIRRSRRWRPDAISTPSRRATRSTSRRRPTTHRSSSTCCGCATCCGWI